MDDVVLVGGSSRVPRLRALVEAAVDAKACRAVNPDEAVAVGAALLAAGRVKLQEVAALRTMIKQDDNVYNIVPGSRLPVCKTVTPHSKGAFTVITT